MYLQPSCTVLKYFINCISEQEESVIEETLTCESPEPMSCYLHHDPDHPMSSFSVINKMRVNIQVRQLSTKIIRYSCKIILFYQIQ